MKGRITTQSEETIKGLVDEVERLRDCIDMLASDCKCSVRERISGHLADCPAPHIRELLKPHDEDGAA